MSFSMKKTAALAAVLALSAVPALAAPPSDPGTSNVPANPGTTHKPTTTPTTPLTPGPDASAAAKGKAYGKYCQGESKKHVKGEKGTPFSRCVSAAAKLKAAQAPAS
jgi:hypothetical protein